MASEKTKILITKFREINKKLEKERIGKLLIFYNFSQIYSRKRNIVSNLTTQKQQNLKVLEYNELLDDNGLTCKNIYYGTQ